LVALDVNTPTEDELAQGQADNAQVQAQLARQTLPADIQYKQALASSAQSQAQQAAMTTQHQMQVDAVQQHRLALLTSAQEAQQTQQQLAGSSGAPTSPLVPAQNSLFSPPVQQAMQNFDPTQPNASANWDATMSQLAQTDPQAKQFIGQYSPQNLKGWLGAAGAHAVSTGVGSQLGTASTTSSPLASASAAPASQLAGATAGAPSAASSQLTPPVPVSPGAPAAAPPAIQTPMANGMPISPLTGKPDPDLAKLAILDPEGAQKQIAMEGMLLFQRTGDMDALRKYAPETFKTLATAQKDLTDAQKTAFETKAAGLGQSANAVLYMMQQVRKAGGDPQTNPTVRGAYEQGVIQAARNGWITPQLAQQELTAPKIDEGQLTYLAVKAQTVTDALKTSGQQAANEQAARVNNPEPNLSYVGTQPGTGNAVVLNTHPAPGQSPLTVTGTPMAAKPSAGAATAQFKHDMMVKAGYSEADAAAAASGSKVMTQAEIMASAQRAAISDAQAQAIANPTAPPVNVDDLAAQYASQWSAAGTPGAAPAGQGAAPTGSAATVHTPAQIKAAQAYKGATGAIGTNAHPSLPTPAQIAQIPSDGPNSFYIGPDGQMRYKGSAANMTKYMGS
jgi:hypothetical protein